MLLSAAWAGEVLPDAPWGKTEDAVRSTLSDAKCKKTRAEERFDSMRCKVRLLDEVKAQAIYRFEGGKLAVVTYELIHGDPHEADRWMKDLEAAHGPPVDRRRGSDAHSSLFAVWDEDGVELQVTVDNGKAHVVLTQTAPKP